MNVVKLLSSPLLVLFVLSFAVVSAVWLSNAETAIPETAEFGPADTVTSSGDVQSGLPRILATHRPGA